MYADWLAFFNASGMKFTMPVGRHCSTTKSVSYTAMTGIIATLIFLVYWWQWSLELGEVLCLQLQFHFRHWLRLRERRQRTPLLLYLLFQLLRAELIWISFGSCLRSDLFLFFSVVADFEKWECIRYPIWQPPHEIIVLVVTVQFNHGNCAGIALLLLLDELSLLLHLCLLYKVLHLWEWGTRLVRLFIICCLRLLVE